MATYKVKDLPGFENLLVVGRGMFFQNAGGTYSVVEVEQIINTSVLIGDRELKINLPPKSMWIESYKLEHIADVEAQHEFATDNPFGKFKYDGRFTKDDLEITYAVYENAVSISIAERLRATVPHQLMYKTIYAASFFQQSSMALELVERMLHDDLDADDLIFELQKIKENYANG